MTKCSFIRLVLAAACAAALSSCHKTLEPDSEFIDSNAVQLSFKGKQVMTYSPATCQLGFMLSRREFRMFDDQMKNWCTVVCSEMPSEVGQKLDATVTWSTSGSEGSEKVKVEVVKVSGKDYWLWCGNKNKRLAVTVRRLD